MNNITLLKKYNNYFNRKVKLLAHLGDYLNEAEDFFICSKPINFRPLDGVNTTQVITMDKDKDFTPDYLLVTDIDTKEILSRWFIMDWVHVAGSQYNAILRRDVLADYFNEIRYAPVFIEKGMLRDSRNPLIFNNEGMTFNEIKKKETLLKDETGIGWLVGYMIQKFPENETEKKFTAEYSYIDGAEVATPWDDINKLVKINFSNTENPSQTHGNITSYEIRTSQLGNYGVALYKTFLDRGPEGNYSARVEFIKEDLSPWGITFLNYLDLTSDLRHWMNLNRKDIIDNLFKPKFNKAYGALTNKEIEALQGKLIVGPDKKLYKLSISKPFSFKHYHDLKDVAANRQVMDTFEELIQSEPNLRKDYNAPRYNRPQDTIIYLSETVDTYIVNAVPAEAFSASLETTVKTSRNHLGDAPYDMFCIPYDRDNIEKTTVKIDGKTIEISNILSLVMAKGMAITGGGLGQSSTYVYDIQYLPYCPIPELKNRAVLSFDDDGNRVFNISSTLGFELDKDYSIIKKSMGDQAEVSVMFWATKRSGTFNIPYKIGYPDNVLLAKVANETERIRLCSPNYAGLFEFTPAKNYGVDYFNVDFTYKPMNPYIHINPNFKGLYGSDYNDSRGLIVGGDFSLETLSDKFIEYELRNKNYAQMFDREIQNMDVNNSLNLTSDIISATLGAATAGVGGAMATGMMGGGPAGMAVGGIASGLGSLAGGAADIFLGQRKFQEERSFKTDMFGYHLGNIKAMPRSLAKTTAFTLNHKIFPFVEEYECTEVEIEALLNKIKYNGMTIMTVGKLNDYIDDNSDEYHFFKGQLIRLDEIADDNHVAQTIYEELDKGVYF